MSSDTSADNNTAGRYYNDLTLPGWISGLWQPGARARLPQQPSAAHRGIVTEVQGGGRVRVLWNHKRHPVWEQGLLLDLNYDVSRMAALQYLGGVFGLGRDPLRLTWTYRGMWDLDGPNRRIKFSEAPDSQFCVQVPGINSIWSDASTRAPLLDGAPWVYAEALRMTALHVGSLRRKKLTQAA